MKKTHIGRNSSGIGYDMASYKRIEEKTPSGGDYSEIYYMDKDGNPTDEDEAVTCVIRECKSDGTLLNEVFGY